MPLSVGRIRFIFSLFVILPPTHTQLRPTNRQNLARFEKTYIFDHFDFRTECFFKKIAKIRKMETFSNFCPPPPALRPPGETTSAGAQG